MSIKLQDIPILSNVEFDIVPANAPCKMTNIFCGYTKIKTISNLTHIQREYIIANKEYVSNLIRETYGQKLLDDFHKDLKAAGCDWI